MMGREQFTTEFRRAMRFVIQKMDRERDALNKHYATQQYEQLAVEAAQTNTDAAIDQLADHVYDAIQLSLEP